MFFADKKTDFKPFMPLYPSSQLLNSADLLLLKATFEFKTAHCPIYKYAKKKQAGKIFIRPAFTLIRILDYYSAEGQLILGLNGAKIPLGLFFQAQT